MKCIII
jgi:hypothetical protein